MRLTRRDWFASCAVALAAGCSDQPGKPHDPAAEAYGPKADPAKLPAHVLNWPGTAFHEVRAYSFHFTEHSSPYLFDKSGTLNPSVREKDGVLLNASQGKRLLDAVRRPRFPNGYNLCVFDPRHAFVFYDDAKRDVAQIEICYECMQAKSKPNSDFLDTLVDFWELSRLFQELGIPHDLNRAEYERIAAEDQARRKSPTLEESLNK